MVENLFKKLRDDKLPPRTTIFSLNPLRYGVIPTTKAKQTRLLKMRGNRSMAAKATLVVRKMMDDWRQLPPGEDMERTVSQLPTANDDQPGGPADDDQECQVAATLGLPIFDFLTVVSSKVIKRMWNQPYRNLWVEQHEVDDGIITDFDPTYCSRYKVCDLFRKGALQVGTVGY
ncbi:MAG: hypothetical protein Q9208_000064 [Pyrenodesmia sp. 3 TL-2023]